MNDTENKNLKKLFASIRYEAEKKRRIEAERQQTLKELLNRPESNPLDEINRQISGVN
jgi:hypothetical protein